jgi:signal transduction histidine kinase
MDLRKKKDPEYYSKIKIDIEDNGIGISQENINKLFIDFGKLNDDEGMNLQGTGLGLSICKRIIE